MTATALSALLFRFGAIRGSRGRWRELEALSDLCCDVFEEEEEEEEEAAEENEERASRQRCEGSKLPEGSLRLGGPKVETALG
jgi:hypothetical protein